MLVGGNSIGMVELTIRCCSSGSRILATMSIVVRIGLGTSAASYGWIAGFMQVSEDALLVTIWRHCWIACMSVNCWNVVDHGYCVFQ